MRALGTTFVLQLTVVVAAPASSRLRDRRSSTCTCMPGAEFYAFLQRLVDAGFSNRIMFGSDQIVWPDAIGRAIETVEGAPFLSEDQRRDIMCRNAMRFLRLRSDVCD